MRAVQTKMFKTVSFKLFFKYWLYGLVLLSYVPISQAQTEALPLDLIELLGELDDEGSALDVALTEIELKKNEKTTQPNEVKK